MRRYAVQLNGENLYWKGPIFNQRVGLYATRDVEASSPDEAKVLAIEILGQKYANDPGVVITPRTLFTVYQVAELKPGETSFATEGATWYPMRYSYIEEFFYEFQFVVARWFGYK